MGGPMQLEPMLFKSQPSFLCVCGSTSTAQTTLRKQSHVQELYERDKITNAALQINSNEDDKHGRRLLEGYTGVAGRGRHA